MNRRVAFLLVVALTLLAVIHIGALYFHWYWSVWWLDMVMHFFAGLWVGGVTIMLFARESSKWSALLYAVTATLFVGMLWEVYEQITGMTFAAHGATLDMISDLTMDAVGGIAAFLHSRTTNG